MRRLLLAFAMFTLGALAFATTNARAGGFDKYKPEVRRIYVAPIELPKKPMVMKPSAGASFLIAGPLGLAINNGTSDYPEAYVKHLADNKIDVAAEIGFELIDQLTAKGYEIVGSEDQADAVLSVQMLQYGLTGGIMSSERFPQLWGNFSLKRNGKKIWKEMGAAHVSKEANQQVERFSLEKYFNDPKLLERQIRAVNRIVIREVVSDL